MATNFLIGRGELLTHVVPPPLRRPSQRSVYTVQEARDVLIPQFASAIDTFDGAPEGALPGDVAVARMTINPTFIARSYFPKDFLREAGLEAVGSRTVNIIPRKWARRGPPQEVTTTELLVAGAPKGFSVVSQFEI